MDHDPLPPHENYEGLPILDQIRLLQEWAPLISYGQRLLATDDHYARAVIVGDALEWLAHKTSTKFDDEFAAHVSAIMRTKEGEALVRWLVSEVVP